MPDPQDRTLADRLESQAAEHGIFAGREYQDDFAPTIREVAKALRSIPVAHCGKPVLVVDHDVCSGCMRPWTSPASQGEQENVRQRERALCNCGRTSAGSSVVTLANIITVIELGYGQILADPEWRAAALRCLRAAHDW